MRQHTPLRIGIAADHGGFHLKDSLIANLRGAGFEIRDFGAYRLNDGDDYPDFIIPLARAVAEGEVDRGIALCGSGVGASVCANKVTGVRAALVENHFSAHQGVEDDHLNVICLGGRTTGIETARELVRAFLAAQPGHEERHLRRLGKVATLETHEVIRDVGH